VAYQPRKAHAARRAEVKGLVSAWQTHATTAELRRYPMGIWDCLSDDKDYPPIL